MPEKKVIFSGIQPSGDLMLGHYLGAIRNWVTLQEEYLSYLCVVDLHAITVRQDPALLKQRTLDVLTWYIAAGIDPERCVLFVQSHVSAHAELGWILGNYTMFGELSRMTQFKEKSARHSDNINGGLFTYPVLMAADILLYRANLVPVGDDQKQHLELCRNIAERFNTIYGETFAIPEPYIPKTSARIMSLQSPDRKMSKSDTGNANTYIRLDESRDSIIKKFRRAVTDSESSVRFAEGKDGINNLMNIYSAATGNSHADIERAFDGRGYGDFKTAVGEAVADMLAPVQKRYAELSADTAYLGGIIKAGAEKAAAAARPTLAAAYKRIGLYSK